MIKFLRDRRSVIAMLLVMLAVVSIAFGVKLTTSTVWAEESTTVKVGEISKIDSEVDMMRYGFNVTGGKSLIDDGLNFSNPVLKSAESGWGDRVGMNVHAAKLEAKGFTGTSAVELASQVGTYTSGGIEAKIAVVNMNVGTEFNTKSSTSEVYEERYESYYQKIKRYTYAIQGDVDLSEYVTDDFKKDVAAISSVSNDSAAATTAATAFLNKYGTHVFTALEYGGVLQVTNYMKTSEHKEGFSSSMSLESKIQASMDKYAAGVGFSFSSEYTNEEVRKYGTSNYTLLGYGGRAITGMTLDQLFKYSESMIDGKGHYIYDIWVQSINDRQQLAIIGSGNSIAVWELLPKGTPSATKTWIIEAYAKMCGDKYAEYLEKYPSSPRTILENDEVGGVDILGYSVKYKDTVKYYEEDSTSADRKVYSGSEIFINYANSQIPAGMMKWKVLSGDNYAEVVDEVNGGFRVKDDVSVGKEFMIGAYNGEEQVGRTLLFKVMGNSNYSGGQGTEDDPYLISSTEDWDTFLREKEYTLNFKLINSIDFGGQAIIGIGDKDAPFSGTFDGNNCKISNFKLITPVNETLGLFAYNSGTVKNLTVSNVIVGEGDNKTGLNIKYAGTIVGHNKGTISNCKVDKTSLHIKYVVGADHTLHVGGVVGHCEGASKVEECGIQNITKIIGTVQNDNKQKTVEVNAGGIVGYANAGGITNCYMKNIDSLQAHGKGGTVKVFCAGGIGKLAGTANLKNIVVGEISTTTISADCNYSYAEKKTLVGAIDGTTTAISSCYAQKNSQAAVGSENCLSLDHQITFKETNFPSDVWMADKTDGFPVLVKQNFNPSTALDVIVDDAQTEFYIGQEFNVKGIKVEGKYSNSNEPFVVEHYSYDATNYNPEVLGDYDITISAMGYSKIYTVKVRKIKVIGYDIKLKDENKLLFAGETINPDDFVISYVLEDGDIIPIPQTDAEKNPNVEYPKNEHKIVEEKYVLGDNKVVVKNDKISSYCIVNAVEKVVESIEIKNRPTYVSYDEGEKFNTNGMVVEATYSDGTKAIINNADLEIIGEIIVAGANKIIISFGDYKTASVDVTGRKVITHTVTFKNWDGSIIETKTYRDGETVVVPAPTRDADSECSYKFNGWDKEIETTCTKDAEYTAQYEKMYTVVFKDWNGAIISKKNYCEDETVSIPSAPTRFADDECSYVFNGWDKTVEVVCTKNAEYVAQYYKTHTVVFKDWNGTVISTKTYRENEEITIPSNPTRSADDECSYLFNGWDRTVETICTKNAEYTAQYAKVFTVIFKNWNGAVISYQTYREGEVVVIPANPNRPADENYSYTFTGWDKNIEAVCTKSVEYAAQYQKTEKGTSSGTGNRYMVSFIDWNGAIISADYYNEGAPVVIPSNPTREDDNDYTYTFSGWSKQVATVCWGDAIYVAQYSKTKKENADSNNKCIVTFMNWNGAIISANYYNVGATVVVPDAPTREEDDNYTYTFSGWNKQVVTVCAGSAVYVAQYSRTEKEKPGGVVENKYMVTFIDWNGAIISANYYEEGDTIVEPSAPTREEDDKYTYTFRSWNKPVAKVCTGDEVYIAQYTQTAKDNADPDGVEDKYMITFTNWDGAIISAEYYTNGDTIVIPANPSREDDKFTYVFTGWDKPILSACDRNEAYFAVYVKEFTVTFKGEDGTVISTKNYLEGDTIEIPNVPSRAGYDGSWNKTVETICTGDAEYTAKYVQQTQQSNSSCAQTTMIGSVGGNNGIGGSGGLMILITVALSAVAFVALKKKRKI